MATVIPEGKLGVAEVDHFVVGESERRVSMFRAIFNDFRELPMEIGTYARLMVEGGVMMSDTAEEKASNAEAVENAVGDVLIAGLGLGMVLMPILAKAEVTSVKVIEKHSDVIALVGFNVTAASGDDAKKLTIIEGDIFTWIPPKGERYDTVYFDIWPVISGDNLKEMKRLHDKFRKRKKEGGWMGSWGRSRIVTNNRVVRKAAAKRQKG